MPKAKAKTRGIPSPQNYLYPNTQILKNKYGETNLELFLEKCSYDIEEATKTLRKEPLPDYFDSAYLCYIHHQLFKNTFEWAGHLRTVPFAFADGSLAAMPEMKKTEWDHVFVSDKEIAENLQKFEETLAEKNNLQGLTRQEFITEAAETFTFLKRIHPFIDGNEHTENLFFENLATAAGHQLDLSLVTQRRMMTAYNEAIQHGNKQPMREIFEDISNPEKMRVLQEFMKNTKESGFDVNNRIVAAAKEGKTYTGIYEGANREGFVLGAQGTYIIGNKDSLTPEQLKTLKLGDPLTFTPQKTEDLEKILIPKETLAPLTKNEFDKILVGNARVSTGREQIQLLSQIIYGNSQALDKQMEKILQNPSLGNQLADQIKRSPHSISQLAGTSLLGLKNSMRKNAEAHVNLLCAAVTNYTDAAQYMHHTIINRQLMEQERCRKAVEKPSQNLQNLLCLSPEQQREVLSQDPLLHQELHTFVVRLEHRLSEDEYRAIKHNDHETLAKSLGVSEHKAKEITNTVQKAKEAHQQAYTRALNRSNALAMAS